MGWRCLLSWRWWLGLQPKYLQRPRPIPAVTVLVPAYNEEESIAKTIASIKVQRRVFIQKIIVIDDCSSDRTGKVARAAGATVLRTPVNQGTKAMAQNWALNHVVSELVVTIDADTLLAPDAIAQTIPYFNDVMTASVCGFVVPQRIQTIFERGRFVEYVFGISVFKSAQDHLNAVMVSSGCFSVFRTAALKKFGGFKQRTMAEDMDLTWEFQRAGYRVYCAPEAFCYPLDPPNAKIFLNQVNRWSRSFFQNIAIHNFRHNRKLGMFIYAYLLEGLFSPLILLWFLWFFASTIVKTMLWGLLIEFLVVSVPCLWWGWRHGMFTIMLTSLPSYFVIKPFNTYVFWRSLWKEWIVRERLTVWEKGH